MLLHKLKHTPEKGTTALKSALRVSAAAALLGLVSTTGAHAATAVTDWNFTLDNAWTFTDPGSPTVTYSNLNAHFGAPSLISWGDPATPNTMQSSLEVGESNGHFEGTVITGGGFVPTVQVIHNNWPQISPSIGGSPWLEMAVLSDLLTLHPTMPNPPFDGTQTHQPPQLDFSILFKETENGPNDEAGEMGSACADTDSPDGGGCNDIFVLQLPLGVEFSGGLLRQNFVFDGYNYEAQIALTGLGALTAAECAAAGVVGPCIGLTTEEEMATMFQASLAIENLGLASEPGALAVFGLGLAGLGFMRRRRKA